MNERQMHNVRRNVFIMGWVVVLNVRVGGGFGKWGFAIVVRMLHAGVRLACSGKNYFTLTPSVLAFSISSCAWALLPFLSSARPRL